MILFRAGHLQPSVVLLYFHFTSLLLTDLFPLFRTRVSLEAEELDELRHREENLLAHMGSQGAGGKTLVSFAKGLGRADAVGPRGEKPTRATEHLSDKVLVESCSSHMSYSSHI